MKIWHALVPNRRCRYVDDVWCDNCSGRNKTVVSVESILKPFCSVSNKIMKSFEFKTLLIFYFRLKYVYHFISAGLDKYIFSKQNQTQVPILILLLIFIMTKTNQSKNIVHIRMFHTFRVLENFKLCNI